ncbi:MAG: CHAT domain-containing protein, partial [Rhabdochlamydiaceae bacterium]|nr:CHAT domain-containing protein [Rhabdochlamydiaceae bacterium]
MVFGTGPYMTMSRQGINNSPVRSEGTGYLYNQAGKKAFQSGDLNKAEDCFKEALKHISPVEDNLKHETLAAALSGLGKICYQRGNLNKALSYHKTAMRELRLMDNPDDNLALTYLDQGNIYFNCGKFTKAEKYYNKALKLARKVQNKSYETQALISLGHVCGRREEKTSALDHYNRAQVLARDLRDEAKLTRIKMGIASAYAENQEWDEAVNRYKEVLHESLPPQERQLLKNNIGYCLMCKGEPEQAEPYLKESMELLESFRKNMVKETDQVFYFEEQSRTYHMLIDALIAQGKTDEALKLADRIKSFALVDAIRKKVGMNDVSIDPISIATKYGTTIIHYTFSFFKKNTLFVWVVSPKSRITFSEIPCPEIQPLDPLVSGDAFNRSENPDSIVTSRFFSFQEIKSVFKTFFGKLIGKNPIIDDLQKWYNILITPIYDNLPREPDHLITIIPDNFLCQMPFSVLVDENGKYLVENHTVTFAPSIATLDLLNTRKQLGVVQREYCPLVIGNPTRDLKGAQDEATNISSIIKGELLSGQKATLSALKEKIVRANFIHLACHGTKDEQKDPFSLYSGALVLSPEKKSKEDAFLFSEDLLELAIRAELVFMSACESGKGTVTREGLIGLNRAFLASGADTVISTLWEVPDDKTRDLAIEFYKHLFGIEEYKKLNKVQALRQS